MAPTPHDVAETGVRFLVSNVAPVHIPASEISVAHLPFESKEQLAKLRKDHFGTHLFKRLGDNRVTCVRLDGQQPQIGESVQRVLLRDDPGLCAMAIRNSIINLYAARKCEVLDYRPIEIVSGSAQQSLLAGSLPAGMVPPAWLSVRQLCEMDLRVVRNGRESFLGLVINLRIRKRILANCSTLLGVGLDLRGLYVAEPGTSDDPRVRAPNRVVGRVVEVEGTTLILNDTRDGNQTANAETTFLRVSADAFERVMQALYGHSAPAYLQRLEDRLADAQQAPVRLERIQGVLGDLQKQKVEAFPGVQIRFGSFLSEADRQFPKVTELGGPIFVFDPAGRKTDTSKARGLDKFGPYTAQTFTPASPRICVVCEASKKGDVERFLKKFLDGTDTAGLRYPPFRKGLCRAYHLKNATTEFFLAANPTASAYLKAAQSALDTLTDTSRWDLALVQTSASSHALRSDQNPYLVTKAVFHSQQIPVQEFEDETMAMAAGNLEYALSNMALASYSKLGGIPWLIKADPTIAHEFVVGLGSSYIGDGVLGQKQRVVGITTIFSGDGNYFLSNLSRAVPMQDFQDALLEALRASFEQVRSRMNWQKGDHVRLVFHSFKPMKDAEAQAVVALAAELTDFAVEFAFVHVVDNHPFLLFDTRQRGERDYRSGKVKGQSVPLRGIYQPLSQREALVTLTGPKELKQVDDGMPFPILLSLHRNSTFVDLNYLARQVFLFSAHSWRSFLPASMPVTIVYSQLIARLLGNLSRLPSWSPDSVRGRLGRSRWFL